MYTIVNSTLGVVFVILSAALTFLMFNIWKYPFDHEKLRSQAPLWMIRLHRVMGYGYVAIYLYLMSQMVPRLWDYQIELPPRTVMHLTLGMSIGAILVVKLVIVRFFKNMEATLVPFLGTALFIFTLLLMFLVLPFSLRDIYLSKAILGSDTLMGERVERVREQLPKAGIEDAAVIDQLASAQGLETGRRVLTTKCVQCHDLRTVLAQPRTPMAWQRTVSRMANRSTVLNPISADDQLFVIAYLIAVSPTLQETLKQRRALQMDSTASQQAMLNARAAMETGDMVLDLAEAEAVFEVTCSQCHGTEQVENAPPSSADEVAALVERMVGNGLMASEQELDQVIYYLTETFAEVPASSDGEQTTTESATSVSGDAGGSVPSNLDGEALFRLKACFGCHGLEGRSPISPTIPKLAGQNQAYLVTQLRDFKSGSRNNAFASRMTAMVATVRIEEIEAIAEYLSGLQR